MINIYKVVFLNNKVLSCHVANTVYDWVGEYFYQHTKGKLIFAMIRAKNETEALDIADIIVEKIKSFS